MSSKAKFTPRQMRAFRKRLLEWFTREQRKLPWRGERDPYRLLVSEIMLQQTRVAVVEDRYTRFLRRFPNVKELARAREQSVLAEWSGLGYYRRARALHAAVKQIRAAGKFPECASEMRHLPGVGRYTAAAVASIAYGEPVAVVDGNVKRVLSRIAGGDLGEEEYWSVAGGLLDSRRPGDFNQAMMELGAVICLPGKPQCERCPVRLFCAVRGSITTRKMERRRKDVVRYALVRRNGSVVLRQRSRSESLMPGMWELPSYEGATRRKPTLKLRHSITNTDYEVLVFAQTAPQPSGIWVSCKKLQRIALTGVARKILRSVSLMEG